MEKFNWTREDTCLLIENFELHPELCNVHTAEFKDRIKKQNALQKLADLFNTSTAEIQSKLHNLRTQVNQEWRKNQKKKSRIFVSFLLILPLTKLSKKSKSSADIRKKIFKLRRIIIS
nr:unnamed protein product [Callosobruchus chinensis]